MSFTTNLAVAAAVATVIPLAVLWLVSAQDTYSSVSRNALLWCVAGGLLAVAMAYAVNTALLQSGRVQSEQLRVVGSPIIEELLKALPLCVLFWRRRVVYTVDAAVYGFASGTAFAIGENLFYLTTVGGGLTLAAERACSTSLLHGSATAMVGLALGKLRFQRPGRQTRPWPVITAVIAIALRVFLRPALLFRAALLRHSGFNYIVGQESPYVVAAAIAVGVGATAVVVWLMHRGLADERRWIQDALAAAGVDAGETTLIGHLGAVHRYLTSIALQFGEDKREQLELLLRLEAQAGLKRKVQQLSADQRERARLDQEIRRLDQQVAGLRHVVGKPCLAYFHRLSWATLGTV